MTPNQGEQLKPPQMALAVLVKIDPDEPPLFYRLETVLPLDSGDFCLVCAPDARPGDTKIGYVTGFERRCEVQMRHLGRLLRRATPEEIDQWHLLRERQQEALAVARARSIERGLQMKFLSVRLNDQLNIVTFHFTADRRVDFRELVRDLAAHFRARIELWQVGSRRGAADRDGCGICGQQFCCTRWIREFPAVSMKHVREQDLANQTPQKLAGSCGRLRCCMRYEHAGYAEALAGAPSVGCAVCCAERGGTVIDRNLLKRTAYVRFEGASRGEWVDFVELRQLDPAPAPPASRADDEVDAEIPNNGN